MNTLIGTCRNASPFAALIGALWIGGSVILKHGHEHWSYSLLADGMFVLAWLTLAYLILATPVKDSDALPGEYQGPGVYDRLIVTLKLGAMSSVIAVVTAVFFATTQDPAKVEALSFVVWIPYYMLIGGAGLAYAMLLLIAVRNRPRPYPVRRCMVDALDIVLGLTFANIAGVSLYLLIHAATGLIDEILPVAFVVLAALIIWRVGPYFRPVLLLFQRQPA